MTYHLYATNIGIEEKQIVQLELEESEGNDKSARVI